MRLIPLSESLSVEFKSDRGPLADDDLVATVVCMANTEGGELYIGVEDDGTPTGLDSRHQNVTEVVALIANQTSPSIPVRAERIEIAGVPVAKIEIPKSEMIVSSSKGLIQRRRLMADGKPGCVPFYPYEFAQRQSDLRRLDYSALPVPASSEDDLDPFERERLRRQIVRYRGDASLLALSDDELDGALGLIAREGGRRVPTVAGLLLLGRESALRTHLPTHEVAAQELARTEVRLNEFIRRPLLEVFERIYEHYFSARVTEEELQVGLFRVPVPQYDGMSFREGLVNALVHRDYTRLGAVHVRWETDGLVISNPGGFIEGVTIDRLLVTEPRPRNPLLADIIKRIGLAERTGRGVDLIYQGLLRYGRPAPDYHRSDAHSVVLRLANADADLPFLDLILEEEGRTNSPLPLDNLIVLAQLRATARLDIKALADATQKDTGVVRALLGRLIGSGLVESHGSPRNREYTLSAAVYRRLGRAGDYVRHAAFDEIQQAQMVLQYVGQHGRITRSDAAELCRLSNDQASRLLRRLVEEGKLFSQGSGRGATYTR